MARPCSANCRCGWRRESRPRWRCRRRHTGAAKLLRADDRIGIIAKDHEATFLLVDGDPTADIHALERIAVLAYKGEVVERPGLLKSARDM